MGGRVRACGSKDLPCFVAPSWLEVPACCRRAARRRKTGPQINDIRDWASGLAKLVPCLVNTLIDTDLASVTNDFTLHSLTLLGSTKVVYATIGASRAWSIDIHAMLHLDLHAPDRRGVAHAPLRKRVVCSMA